MFGEKLVACTYSQIPGVDFSNHYLAVVNNVTNQIMILLLMIYSFSEKIVEVEAAFLSRELEEEIYMEHQLCMNVSNDEILLQNKCIYGLEQAARQYYKKAVVTLKKLRFTGGDDPVYS